MSRSGLVTLFVLAACGSSVPGPVEAFPRGSGYRPQYEVEVVVNGVPLREYLHEGDNFVEGRAGDRYALRVRNNTGRRVEVVATVDGLDVVDGKTGGFSKRGYVIAPWQTYDIEGFRLDMGRVAAFRFGSVADSYAARKGDARNVGVIGVAFFAERQIVRRPPPPPVRPDYPDYDDWRWGTRGGAGRAEQAPAAKSAPGDAGSGSFGAADKPTALPAPACEAMANRGYARDDSWAAPPRSRPGLGTEFGESRHSNVRETSFVRANSSSPTEVVTVRYNDRAGLVAMGVPVHDPPWYPSDAWTRKTADPFPANPYPPSRTFATPPAGWDD
jgi:hypothetical protein